MRRENPALRVNQRNLCVLYLARPAFTAQLPDGLRDRKDRPRMARMAMREQPAVRVDRQLATELDTAALDEGPSLDRKSVV